MDRLRTLRQPELHPYLTEVPVTSREGDTSREDQHILGDNTSSSLVKHVSFDRSVWRLFVIFSRWRVRFSQS